MLSQIEADIFVHLSQTVGYNESQMKACGTTKKASPFGRGGNACIDGEGKPVVKESRYSDEQKPLAEGEHRCALCSWAAALPSQALTRQDRVAAPSIRHASLASCWPLPQQLLPVSATGGGRRRCSQGESLYERALGKIIFTAKNPFWLSVVRVPLYF